MRWASVLLILLLACDDDAASSATADVPVRGDASTTDGGGMGGGVVPPGGICVPDETRCVDARLRTCLEDGTGWLVEACPEGEECREGACIERACGPGERRCAEGGVETCGDLSEWGAAVPCPADHSCREGVCLAQSCSPGELACADRASLVCDSDGLGWTRTPCDERCVDGECTDEPGGIECPPGQVLCAPSGIVECAEDGASFVETPCDEGEACFEGRCVACLRNSDCPDGSACADGECGPPPLAVVTAELPPAQVDVPYLIDLEAANGTPDYTWAPVDGALPEGLELDPEGPLHGTPTEVGRFPFTVEVTDAAEGAARAELVLLVLGEGLAIATESPLRAAEEGSDYSTRFEAVGGVPPYGWLVTEGALPGGMVLRADGTLAGVPNEIGVFEFTMRVVDAGDPPAFAEKRFLLEVEVAPLEIVGDQVFDLFFTKLVTLPVITVIQDIPIPYRTQLTARGGLRPYHWSERDIPDGLRNFLPQAGIPDGLNLREDGTLEGAVVDTAQVIELQIPFTQIRLTGFFFMARVADSQGVADTAEAVFLLPTIPLGGM